MTPPKITQIKKRNLTLYEVGEIVKTLIIEYGDDAINVRTNLVDIKTRKHHPTTSSAGKIYFT